MRSALLFHRYDASVYTGHSFRIGAATTAAEQGIKDSVIKMLHVGRLGEFSVSVRCSFILGEALFNIENDSVNVCIIIICYSSSSNTVLFTCIILIDMSGYLRLRSTGSKPVLCIQGPIVYVNNYS